MEDAQLMPGLGTGASKGLLWLSRLTCQRAPGTRRWTPCWWLCLLGPLAFASQVLLPVTITNELDASGCLNFFTTIGTLFVSITGRFFTVDEVAAITDTVYRSLDEDFKRKANRKARMHLVGGVAIFILMAVAMSYLFEPWVQQLYMHYGHGFTLIDACFMGAAVLLMYWTTCWLLIVSYCCCMIQLGIRSCASEAVAFQTTLKSRGYQVSAPVNAAAMQQDVAQFVQLQGQKLQNIRQAADDFSRLVGPWVALAVWCHGQDLVAYTLAFMFSNFFADVPLYQYWLGAVFDSFCIIMTVWPLTRVSEEARTIGREADHLMAIANEVGDWEVAAILSHHASLARSFATNTYLRVGKFAMRPAVLSSFIVFLCSAATGVFNVLHHSGDWAGAH